MREHLLVLSCPGGRGAATSPIFLRGAAAMYVQKRRNRNKSAPRLETLDERVVPATIAIHHAAVGTFLPRSAVLVQARVGTNLRGGVFTAIRGAKGMGL